MLFDYEEFDLSGVRTYPLASRASKARAEDFARPVAAGGELRGLVRVAAGDPRRAGSASRGQPRSSTPKRRDGGIVWGLGAHVIKTGVSPVLIDLMERGYVSALAMNGAGIIHDFEIALSGATSEDVDDALGPGRFGMAEETGRLLNEAIRRGAEQKLRPRAVGRALPGRAEPATRPAAASRSPRIALAFR